MPAESNPPGDIPDNTVFVPYHSAKGGWTVTIPEGWSRTTTGTTVTFTSTVRPNRPELPQAHVQFVVYELISGAWTRILDKTLGVDSAGVP